ncbi:MAG: T9SS type A sorting domain-containing protein [Saprospiraceae bacterium]|nr:T9SS type A sorting domain-containing protein [Saprospiraceae bacterium]
MSTTSAPICLFILLLPIALFAQQKRLLNAAANFEQLSIDRNYAGFERSSATTGVRYRGVPRSANFLNQEVVVGSTLFDLQTNASLSNRLYLGADGTKVAAWMLDLSFSDDAPDRGTGINQHIDSWQALPQMRIESERTGWPSVSRLGDGRLIVTSHTVDNELILSRQAVDGVWMESKLPTITPKGRLWPHSTVGGSDEMSIHLVALSTPTAFEGEPYLGMEGQLLYCRSTDGGDTWDQVDMIIPGLDSSKHLRIDPDAYEIVGDGEIVAITHFGGWGDVTLFKSTDNGDTWNSIIIRDFPLDKYVIDSGYSVDDIPLDTLAPESLAILTSSGEGDLAIDRDGNIHITFADMYVRDSTLDDEGTTFYPFRSGISYWNESMAAPMFIGGVIDYDNNDTLSIDVRQIARYGNSTLTSTPTISLDQQGGVYVAYSAVSEAHFNEKDEQHYRHLVVLKSLDGGINWGPLYDLINDEFSDPEFNYFIEAVYPSSAMLAADTLHILYQQDFFPGHRLVDSMDARAENFMVYLAVPTDLIPYDGPVSIQEDVLALGIQAFPNPTENEVTIRSTDMPSGTFFEVQVFNLSGQLMYALSNRPLPIQLELGFLPQGPYLVRVSAAEGVGWTKLVKR